MTRDGISRMDFDTRWPYHRKARRLQRLYPKNWPTYHAAWMALLGEVWFNKNREITLEDAWLPALPCTVVDATAALVAAGYLDSDGRIPPDSWDEWVEPAIARIEASSVQGRNAANKRWHSEGNASAMPEQSSRYAPRQPTTPATPTTPTNDANHPTTPPISPAAAVDESAPSKKGTNGRATTIREESADPDADRQSRIARALAVINDPTAPEDKREMAQAELGRLRYAA